MKITKCSASAIQTYEHCNFKYYMSRVLNMEDAAGKAALQGTIVHQVFEWMGKLKRKNKTHIDPEWLLERSWDMHTAKNPHIEIRRTTSKGEAADFRKCRESVEVILNDDTYNPYKMENIIDSERWFSVEFPGEEWETHEGEQFRTRGFIDLVRELDKETIEIIDWKTGKRLDFYTRQPIDVLQLMREIQPRLYHLASCMIYSEYKNIVITFYYTSDGGPVTISLSLEDIPHTIAAIWAFFKRVEKDTLFRRNRSWKCRMCAYNKNDICTKVWSDLHTLGSEFVEQKYVDMTVEQQRADQLPDLMSKETKDVALEVYSM